MDACVFCGKPMPAIETAINDGWEPSYFDGQHPCDGPVCPRCVAAKLTIGRDGELEILFPEIVLR